jgi:ATP-binding protein involved in chromosome partitioning
VKGYFDIAGDGGSEILRQVGEQREAIATSLAPVRRMVAVGSGKGGVGKSTVTMVLAQLLRSRGRRVAILDADVNGPSQARMAGLEEVPWLPGERGLALPSRADGLGVVSLGSVVPEDRPVDFEVVAEGDGHVWRATREITLLGQLLATIEWPELDFLLVDLPPGTERTVHMAGFLGAAASLVLVTVPSDVSRGVVARSVSALAGAGAKVLGYVENMVGYFCRGCGEVRPLFPTASEPLELPRLGSLAFDPELAALCDRGWPVGTVPDLRPLADLEPAADHLEQLLETRP